MSTKIYFHPSDMVLQLRDRKVTIWTGACMPADYFYKWFKVQYFDESDWTCWIDDTNFLNLRHNCEFAMKFPLYNQ